ncbi:RNA-guided endonuclease IscB [Paracandidimonas soli]|uniref:RNA-guided endonuclease IscB n=1 Tax=Paracandidimonas soli TaxID=1917182 RepID=UPI00333E2503
MAVYVLDKQGRALMPCSEKRARLLLARGRARVHRLTPFVIRLVDRLRIDSDVQPLTLKLDPGSRFTGMALVRQQAQRLSVLSLFELLHRGAAISKALGQRAGFRRRRRSANLRHRAPRFDNRTKPSGWLPPSLRHRLDTTLGWVTRLRRWAPITDLAVERVKSDMQVMQNPEISGVEYQQGELFGYEVREYLLEKWGRCCAYCGAENTPLEIEHIIARGNGGSNRVSNLTLACRSCNQRKGSQPVEWFLKNKLQLLARIKARAKAPLRDAAAVNATRNALLGALLHTGLALATGTGAQTKYNRRRLGIPKAHTLDAVCVGDVQAVKGWQRPTLTIKATGRGDYQRTRLTASGFPRGYLTRQKQHFGFQTGDQVLANVPAGKKAGMHRGRVAVRKTGSFNIQTPDGVIQGISHRHCRIIQRADGYAYTQSRFDSAQLEQEAARTGAH